MIPDDLGLLWKNRSGRVRTTPDARRGVNAIERSHALAAESLISDLNSLRQAAGNPALGQLVRLSQHKIAKATLDDHLSGRRKRLPPWRLVSAYVSACHEAAASTGLDVGRLGTLDEWYTRWESALKGEVEVVSPVRRPINVDDGIALDKRTLSLDDSFEEVSKRFDVEFPTLVKDPNDSIVSIAPVLKRLEEKFSKLARSLPTYSGLLIVTSGATIGAHFQIEHNITTIGRYPESDIWLNDPTVSRRHAVIHRHGDRFFVDDIGSHNGTLLRQRRIDQKVALSPYDELRIGALILLFMQGGVSSRTSSRKGNLPFGSRLAADVAKDTQIVQSLQSPAEKEWPQGRSDTDSQFSRMRWRRNRNRD